MEPVKPVDRSKLSNTVGVVARNSIDYVRTCFRVVGSGNTVVPLRAVDDEYRIAETRPTEVLTPELGTGWFEIDLPASKDPSTIAQISFTSGTEGKPKGVLLSRAALDDVVDRLQHLMDPDAGLREYVGVPVYHSFGYGRCRLAARVGGAAYLPSEGFSPSEIADMLSTGEINSLSAVPTQLKILLKASHLFDSGRTKLKWIEIGSQPMNSHDKRALRELFPRARIIQHYGLTEASRSTLLEIHDAKDGALESVGYARLPTQVRIDAEGRIEIKGPHLASGLLIDGEILPLANQDGWFTTKDLGRLAEGYLHFVGRADNQINCGGQKTSAERLEATIEARTRVTSGFAIGRIPHETYGEAILLAIQSNLEPSRKMLVEAAREALKLDGILATNALEDIVVPQIPVTDTGKVQRSRLSRLYQERQAGDSDQASIADSQGSLVEVLRRVIGERDFREDVAFEDFGLDSIRMVELALVVERHLGRLPHRWRRLSPKEILEEQRKSPTGTPSGRPENDMSGSRNQNPPGISFFDLIREDFETHGRDWASQGFWAVFVNRFGNWRMGRPKIVRAPLTLLYRMQRRLVQVACGIKLDYTVRLGRRVKLEHFGGMILGAREIGDDVVVRQNTTMGIRDMGNLKGKPRIEEGVNIGAGAVIVGDIVVGRHSVIGPNVVIDRDVPAFSLLRAPPAQPVPLTESEGAASEDKR